MFATDKSSINLITLSGLSEVERVLLKIKLTRLHAPVAKLAPIMALTEILDIIKLTSL